MISFCTCTGSYTGFSTYFNHILFDTSYMSSSRLCVRVLSVNSCVWGLKWTTTGLSETLLLDSWDKCASRWWCLVFTTQSNQFCSKLVNNTSFNQNKQKTFATFILCGGTMHMICLCMKCYICFIKTQHCKLNIFELFLDFYEQAVNKRTSFFFCEEKVK